MIESSDDSMSHFIELPNNPYLTSPYLEDGRQQIMITKQEDMIRRTDPESFFYLIIHKLMRNNPAANTTCEIKKEFISEDHKDFGRFRPLLYRKMPKISKDAFFKQAGVINQESFEFDEIKRRRNEYMNYCIKKIESGIRGETMDPKEAEKSPLNIQKAQSKRRHDKRGFMQE